MYAHVRTFLLCRRPACQHASAMLYEISFLFLHEWRVFGFSNFYVQNSIDTLEIKVFKCIPLFESILFLYYRLHGKEISRIEGKHTACYISY